MMVKFSPTNIKDKAIEIFRNGKYTLKLNIRIDQTQQCCGKNIIGMEFSAVGKAFCRDFHGLQAGRLQTASADQEIKGKGAV